MVAVTVERGFYDSVERTHRHVGDSFEATEARAREIKRKLPGYVTVSQSDVSDMSMSELRAEAKSRGIRVPRGAKRDDIIALIEV